MSAIPTREQVLSLVRYNPESGEFFYLKNGEKTSPSKRKGYNSIKIGGRYHYCHRLAWLIEHNAWPDLYIDHINRDRSDNRISNLRLATPAENQYNRPAQRNNSCGVKNVYWRANRKRWMVVVRANGITKTVGLRKTLSEASALAAEYREKVHGEFAMH